MYGSEAIYRVCKMRQNGRVLDIGSGGGEQARYFTACGFDVTTISCVPPADFVGKYQDYDSPQGFDVVWASHVLEHQGNPQDFIVRMMLDCKAGGLIAITVPPAKHDIVGGHLTLWNAGLLVYNCVAAGLDCSKARVSPLYDGYNISIIVENYQRPTVDLVNDAGDIERLSRWFPFRVYQGFPGNQVQANWGTE